MRSLTVAAAPETRPGHRKVRVTVAPTAVLTSLSHEIRNSGFVSLVNLGDESCFLQPSS